MKELFKIIKENFILLLGTGLFTYGLFNLRVVHFVRSAKKLKPGVSSAVNYISYDDPMGLFLIAAGVILIVIGLIKLKTKKDR